MKRCIVCGNIGDGSSEVCEVCGNPYGELEYIPETADDTGYFNPKYRTSPVNGPEISLESAQYEGKTEPDVARAEDEAKPVQDIIQKESEPVQDITQKESESVQAEPGNVAGPVRDVAQKIEKTEQADQKEEIEPEIGTDSVQASTENKPVSAPVNQQVRTDNYAAHPELADHQHHRMRSGPQIYGQAGQMPGDQNYSQQGMIRRTVQGRPGAQTAPNRTAGQSRQTGEAVPVQQMRPAGSQMAGQQTRPVNGQMAGQQARPVNGQMAGQQVRPANSQMAGQQVRPVNGQMAGQQARPVNGQMAGQQVRPVNGQMAGQQVRPVNGQMAGQQMRPGNSQMQARGARPAVHSPGQRAYQICETSRKMLKSPIFLLVVLLHTVFLAGSVAAIFMGQLNFSQAARLVTSFDLPRQISGYANSLTSILTLMDSESMIWVNVALHIPDLLFCVGLWLVFFTALTARDHMPGIGFSLMRVDIIINMIIGCIVILLMLVVFVAVAVAAWVSGNTSSIIAAAILLVVMIIVAMMVIMYYFSYLATLNTFRINADTGESYGKASAYVGIMHIILALTAIINLLSGIVNNEIAGMAGAIGKLGWMLLFGIWIMMYRGNMEDLEEE